MQDSVEEIAAMVRRKVQDIPASLGEYLGRFLSDISLKDALQRGAKRSALGFRGKFSRVVRALACASGAERRAMGTGPFEQYV